MSAIETFIQSMADEYCVRTDTEDCTTRVYFREVPDDEEPPPFELLSIVPSEDGDDAVETHQGFLEMISDPEGGALAAFHDEVRKNPVLVI